MEGLKERIKDVRERIERACSRAGHSSSEIILVGVTKGVSVEIIREAVASGINTFGENKVQEGKEKINKLGIKEGITWHMIGHLQTNKVKDALSLFSLIHSVDSLRLCEKLNREAQKRGKAQDILLEINLTEDAARYGFSEKELFASIKSMEGYTGIRVLGLMGIAPFSGSPENSRRYFQRLFNLRKEISEMKLPQNIEMKYLSMGMTQDFEVAIEEGANIVRIGRAIFGERFNG